MSDEALEALAEPDSAPSPPPLEETSEAVSSPSPEAVPPPPPGPPPEPERRGIFVEFTPEGKINVLPEGVGITEVLTILELSVVRWRSDLGLS
jgi:hypothetical protein